MVLSDEPHHPSAVTSQAVTTWKDLGSAKSAEEYAAQLPAGILNVSFSTAGLSHLPSLARLPYLQSLAASFNLLSALTPDQLTLSSHLKVISFSHW